MNQSSTQTKPATRRRVVAVEESVHKRLRIMAAETGFTMSSIVEHLVNTEYHKHKRSKDNENETK